MTTVGHVAGRIPMPAPLLAAVLEELGLEEASYVRHLANVDEADIMAACGTIKVAEKPLTPAAKGMAVLLWRVGRPRGPRRAPKQSRWRHKLFGTPPLLWNARSCR